MMTDMRNSAELPKNVVAQAVTSLDTSKIGSRKAL
jgi:hypothetical protein